MAEEKKLTRIGVDVDEETLRQVDELAVRERWSRKMIATVALENYLKLRGVRNENSTTPKSD